MTFKEKDLKNMQSQMMAMQTKMENMQVTGSAGNELVKITLNGTGKMQGISISPDCVDKEDIEGLEDLIKKAHDNAWSAIENQAQEAFSGMGSPF